MHSLVPALLSMIALTACDNSQPAPPAPQPPECAGTLAGGVSGKLSGCYASAAVSPTTGASFLRLTHAAASVMGAGDLQAELDLDGRLGPATFDDANAHAITATLDLGATTYRAAAGTSFAAADHHGSATLLISDVGPTDSYGVVSSIDGTLTATLVADDPSAAPIMATLTF
jgi:hypothetical protein